MIEAIIYHNDENGFTVFLLNSEDEDFPVTCTGYISDPREGETLDVAGNWVDNPRYGRQIQVKTAERAVPTTESGIEKYLASGVIKGIGAKTARQIVARFGEETFAVLENTPEKLARIKGISLKRALEFAESFHQQHDQRMAILFLQEYGVTPAGAIKIYKRYKEETVGLVRENPYRLADEIDGIGFKTADAIAHRMGVARDSAARISAGVRYTLWAAMDDGHSYMPTGELVTKSAELLYVDRGIIENQLEKMQINREIIREIMDGVPEPIVFVPPLYYAEQAAAQKLLALVRAFGNEIGKKSEIKSDIELSEGQRQAAEAALSRGVLVITGGPGTGKTTTINTVIAMLEQQKLHITLAAPTGRAAKRMTEATGREACTIHRLLEVEFMSENTRRQRFKKNEDDPLETDVLIVDEFSMVDIMLLRSLLAAIAEGTRLIIVGDVDQLPSVGAGNVLADLISSGVLPVVRLTEVFRQAAQSAIITNAHRINRGLYPELNDKERDFFHVRRMQPEAVASTLLDLITERLPAWKGYKPEDIQVLSPMRRGVLGVTNLNTVLQARLNPPARDKNEREHGSVVFRVGDRVMQVKNNYDAAWEMLDARGRRIDFGEGVFNGDMGVVAEVDEDDGLTVEFDGGHRISYDFSRLDELELAYAVTVHKSQGSEYPVVILPLAGGPPMLLSRNLLYTAVTRARDLCIIVGREDVLHRMVDNSRETERYTALARRLQMLDGALGQTTLTD